jgi:ATP-dependent RNA helicase DeaD
VGAIDIHETHALVDVASEHVALVLKKLEGICIKDVPMRPVVAPRG